MGEAQAVAVLVHDGVAEEAVGVGGASPAFGRVQDHVAGGGEEVVREDAVGPVDGLGGDADITAGVRRAAGAPRRAVVPLVVVEADARVADARERLPAGEGVDELGDPDLAVGDAPNFESIELNRLLFATPSPTPLEIERPSGTNDHVRFRGVPTEPQYDPLG